MRLHRYRPRLLAAGIVAAVLSLAVTTLTAQAGTADTTGAARLQQNPSWGQSLPPADAPTSRAYDLIVEDNSSGYTPQSGECSKEIHARYWTYGPDGKVYPTWHPPRDSSGCTFGHEHGDDPRNSELFPSEGWAPFGYTSEVLAESTSESSHRHEDHVGHKYLAINNVNVIQGDNGTSFFPPTGNTIATCDVLLKIHQGTHSPDAFTNNVHELMFDQRCNQNGQTIETDFTGLIPNGRPGGFNATDCPGPFASKFTNVGPAVPADSPSDTRTLGRLITDTACVQAILEGKTHFEVITGTYIPFDTNDLHEFWFSDITVAGQGANFNLQSLWYVLNPSRHYDASKPDNIARNVDLCYEHPNFPGPHCNQARQVTQQTGQQVQWNSPDSPFKGSLREFRPGMFTQSGGGTVYTDVYGRNASSTPFDGSIEQTFNGSTQSPLYVRGSTKDYAANPADRIHAPN